jgi:hypothetical protein
VHTTYVITCGCGHRNTISWPKGKSGFFACKGCGKIINIVSKSDPSQSLGILFSFLIVALIVAGWIAISTLAPKSERKSVSTNVPTYVPIAPIAPKQIEIPCIATTEADCKNQTGCSWDRTCVTIKGSRKPPECTVGVCIERSRITPRPTTPAITTPNPTGGAGNLHGSALPPPPTSTIVKSGRKNAIAPLTIESEAGTNYLWRVYVPTSFDSATADFTQQIGTFQFGSKADILRCGSDVRFTRNSGHSRRTQSFQKPLNRSGASAV